MKLTVILAFVPFIALSTCNGGKGTTKESSGKDDTPPVQSQNPTVAEKAKQVPLTPSTVKEFVLWASGSDVTEKETVRKEIAKASKDQEVLKRLLEEYDKTNITDMGYSLIVLSVVGEMQNPASLPRLKEIAWADLPTPKEEPHAALTERDVKEILASKAVEGIAYLKTAESNRTVLDIVAKHPSQAVRSTAIDAFLYNNSDSEDAKKTLRKIAKKEDLMLIDRTRFSAGTQKAGFEQKLEVFYKNNPNEIAPAPGEPAKDDRKRDTAEAVKPINPPKRNQK